MLVDLGLVWVVDLVVTYLVYKLKKAFVTVVTIDWVNTNAGTIKMFF